MRYSFDDVLPRKAHRSCFAITIIKHECHFFQSLDLLRFDYGRNYISGELSPSRAALAFVTDHILTSSQGFRRLLLEAFVSLPTPDSTLPVYQYIQYYASSLPSPIKNR